MIKKIIATLSFLTVLLSCSHFQTEDSQVKSPDPIRVSIAVNDKECQPVPAEEYLNGKPSVSQLSWIWGDEAYIKMFSGLSVADTTRLWNDLIIFKKLNIKTVHIFLNSPGGGAFDGIAMAYHIMKAQEDGVDIEIHASGIVASAAVPILAAAKKRYALRGTIFMVHEAALWKWPGRETASDIRSQNELMELLRDEYLSILSDKTSTSRESWEAMEGRTTWFNCKKAMELGLIDGIE